MECFEDITTKNPTFSNTDPKVLSRLNMLPGIVPRLPTISSGPWIVVFDSAMSRRRKRIDSFELGGIIEGYKLERYGMLAKKCRDLEAGTGPKPWCINGYYTDPTTQAVMNRIAKHYRNSRNEFRIPPATALRGGQFLSNPQRLH
jgi:hypothetical protein